MAAAQHTVIRQGLRCACAGGTHMHHAGARRTIFNALSTSRGSACASAARRAAFSALNTAFVTASAAAGPCDSTSLASWLVMFAPITCARAQRLVSAEAAARELACSRRAHGLCGAVTRIQLGGVREQEGAHDVDKQLVRALAWQQQRRATSAAATCGAFAGAAHDDSRPQPRLSLWSDHPEDDEQLDLLIEGQPGARAVWCVGCVPAAPSCARWRLHAGQLTT